MFYWFNALFKVDGPSLEPEPPSCYTESWWKRSKYKDNTVTITFSVWWLTALVMAFNERSKNEEQKIIIIISHKSQTLLSGCNLISQRTPELSEKQWVIFSVIFSQMRLIQTRIKSQSASVKHASTRPPAGKPREGSWMLYHESGLSEGSPVRLVRAL